MITFLIDMSGRISDKSLLLPLFHHCIADGSVSMIPNAQNCRDIQSHISDYFKFQSLKVYQIIMVIPHDDAIPDTNEIIDACTSKTFLHLIIPYDAHVYRNNHELTKLIDMNRLKEAFDSTNLHLSVVCAPWRERNQEEKLQSQLFLCSVIESMIQGAQSGLADTLTRNKVLTRADGSPQFNVFKTALAAHLHGLERFSQTLQKFRQPGQLSTDGIPLTNASEDQLPFEVSGCQIAPYRFPWPVKPKAFTRGFRAPVNNWLQQQQKTLDEYTRTCDKLVLDYQQKHYQRKCETQKTSVSVENALLSIEKQIFQITSALSAVRRVSLHTSQRIFKIQRQDIPALLKALHKIPDSLSLILFTCVALLLLAGTTTGLLTVSPGSAVLVIIVQLLLIFFCVVLSLYIFVYKAVKRETARIYDKLQSLSRDIEENARHEAKEIDMRWRLQCHVHHKENLEAFTERTLLLRLAATIHLERITKMTAYWDFWRGRHIEDTDPDVTGVDIRRPPEELELYALSKYCTASGEIECTVHGKTLAIRTPFSGLLDHLQFNEVA